MREVSCRRQQGVAPAGGHTYTFHFPLTHLHRNPAEPQPAQTAAPEHPHAPKLQGDPQVWRSRLHPSTHSRRVAYPPSSCTTRAAAGRKIHPRQNVKCVGATPGRPTPGLCRCDPRAMDPRAMPGEEGAWATSGDSSQGDGATPRGPREEAVQGAGMWGPFHAQGAAESNASVRL